MRTDGISVVCVWFGLGLYHMLSPPHRVCFEWPGKPGCGAVLFTGVYGCSWFSFGFAMGVFLLAAHLCFVWTSIGLLAIDVVPEKHLGLSVFLIWLLKPALRVFIAFHANSFRGFACA